MQGYRGDPSASTLPKEKLLGLAQQLAIDT